MMRTYNPAYMSFDEASRGSLISGKIADFVVLSENPLTIEQGRIQDINVLGLYLAGKKYIPNRKGALGLLFTSVFRILLRKKFL
jgi:predicted amidohydrolase YtcJ